MCRGYRRRSADAWRQTRLLGAILLNVNRGPGSLPVVPEEWMPLPGDAPPAPPMDEENFDDTMARLAAFDNL